VTPDQKDWIAIGGSAGLLAALYAWSRNGSGVAAVGLGRLGQAYPVTVTDGSGNPVNGQLAPGSWYYVTVTGLQPTDWVETNASNTGWVGTSYNSMCGQGCNGYDNVLPANWTPMFPTSPYGPLQNYSWATGGSRGNPAEVVAGATDIDHGAWSQGQISPQQPGSYTILVAVDGQIVARIPITVTGASGAYTGGGIRVGTPIPNSTPASAPPAATSASTTAPASAGATSGPVSLLQAIAPSSGPSSVALVPAAASSQTVQMVPASTASSSITNWFEQSWMGIPYWLLLAAAAGAAWYITKEH
jgi:hypothetical protein